MADLSGRPRERGQLLIITALSIAVLLVLLALALNTAVFGEVHVASTDDILQEERSAVQYEESVQRGIEPLILPVNDDTTGGYSDLRSALADEISNWVSAISEMYAHSGASTNVELEQAHFETDVTHDNESRVFTSAEDDDEWRLAEDVEAVEQYEMSIEPDELVRTNECAGEDLCFTIESDDVWTLYAYESGEDKIAITVEHSDGTDNCDTDDTTGELNLTAGTFEDGEDECEFRTFLEDADPPHGLTYTNAGNASGTYQLVSDGSFDEEHYHDADSGDSPRFDPRIVAADVSVQYRSSELHYRNEFRIVPDDANE